MTKKRLRTLFLIIFILFIGFILIFLFRSRINLRHRFLFTDVTGQSRSATKTDSLISLEDDQSSLDITLLTVPSVSGLTY